MTVKKKMARKYEERYQWYWKWLGAGLKVQSTGENLGSLGNSRILRGLPDLFFFGQEDDAVFTFPFAIFWITAADHFVKFPTGLCSIYISKALCSSFFRTGGNFPAWSIIEKFLYPLNADFFAMNQLPQTEEPSNIIFWVESVFVFAKRSNQTMLFIKT